MCLDCRRPCSATGNNEIIILIIMNRILKWIRFYDVVRPNKAIQFFPFLSISVSLFLCFGSLFENITKRRLPQLIPLAGYLVG